MVTRSTNTLFTGREDLLQELEGLVRDAAKNPRVRQGYGQPPQQGYGQPSLPRDGQLSGVRILSDGTTWNKPQVAHNGISPLANLNMAEVNTLDMDNTVGTTNTRDMMSMETRRAE